MDDDDAARAEIKQILHRYCQAVDRGDRALFRSIYHPDAIEHHGNFDGLGLENHIQGTKDLCDPSDWPGFARNLATASAPAGRPGATHE